MQKINRLILTLVIFLLLPFSLNIQVSATSTIDFEDIFNRHKSVMLIIHPQSGEIDYANQAAADFYGYSIETLMDMNITEINTLSPEEIAAERQRALEESRNFFIFHHQLANGDIKTVHVYSYPIVIDDVDYLFSIIIDQTVFLIQQQRERDLIIVIIALLLIGLAIVSYFILKMIQTNRALKESEQRFEALHNASFGGISIHEKGFILDCNQGLSEMTGFTPKELIGMNGLLLIEPSQREFVLGKITSKSEEPYETIGIKKNGDTYPMRIEARNVKYKGKDVRVTEFRDISEIRKHEHEKYQLEVQYQKLVSEMPLGLSVRQVIFNEQGLPVDFKFLSGNRSFEAILGHKMDDVIDRSALEIFPHLNKRFIELFGQVALTGQPMEVEEHQELLDKWLKIRVYALSKEIVVTIIEDITDRKTVEDKIVFASHHDFLTNLPNRRYLDTTLDSIDRSEEFPILFAVLDIDGLKLINDTYGHREGDLAILHVSQSLSATWGEEAFIARTGGDEFIIIQTNADLEQFKVKRDELVNQLASTKINEIPLSISFGIALKTIVDEESQDVILRAENDMYADKTLHSQSLRNKVIVALFESLKEKYESERIHSNLVSHYCLLMGDALELSHNEKLELELAGRLHDIGKITIPDHILRKPAKLSPDEWEIMKTHTTNGYQILRSADQYSRLADYALSHHERWEGGGYPKGIKGIAIPQSSRIIAICDAFEAMISERPYRKARSIEEAVAELQRCAGTQFDPELVDIFVNKVIATQLPL